MENQKQITKCSPFICFNTVSLFILIQFEEKKKTTTVEVGENIHDYSFVTRMKYCNCIAQRKTAASHNLSDSL